MRQKTFSNAQLLPEVVKMLNEGHTVTLPLKGYSMRPFLENGRDKALLIKVQHIKKGDPVLAEVQPGHYVLHRIVAIHGDRVVLCGDGNLANDARMYALRWWDFIAKGARHWIASTGANGAFTLQSGCIFALSVVFFWAFIAVFG